MFAEFTQSTTFKTFHLFLFSVSFFLEGEKKGKKNNKIGIFDMLMELRLYN